MLRLFRNKKAQNTAEYALLIAIVIGVFSIMQVYLKRGMQSRLKEGMDNIPAIVVAQETAVSSSGLFGTNEQYEPYYYREGAYNINTTSSEGTEKGTIANTATGLAGVRDLANATASRVGSQEITGYKATD